MHSNLNRSVSNEIINIKNQLYMRIHPYVDTTRANADGTYPVYIVVKNSQGRFFVNTGLSTTDKLVGVAFPKSDKAGKTKTTLLGRYLADTEVLCLQGELSKHDNRQLKKDIQENVFGVVPKSKISTLSYYIREFAATKKEQTRSIYELTARKVDAFDQKASLSIEKEWLDLFRSHYIDEGMSINGVGKELRNIRAVFNWARKQGYTKNYPFLDYHIIEEETVPNNISAEDLRRLRDYPCESWQKPYVDFFFLSFYLAGINPIDLLSLKADSIKDGHLTFVRQKTNKQGALKIRTITLPVLPEAKAIIDRYPSSDGFLLGFMDCRNNYNSFVRQANDALKKIGPWRKVKDKVGKLRKMEYSPICPEITLYSARYSFGSIAANDLDISERTIGMCLGHSWAKNVTSRYMATDQRKIDNAVKRVIEWFAAPESTT